MMCTRCNITSRVRILRRFMFSTPATRPIGFREKRTDNTDVVMLLTRAHRIRVVRISHVVLFSSARDRNQSSRIVTVITNWYLRLIKQNTPTCTMSTRRAISQAS